MLLSTFAYGAGRAFAPLRKNIRNFTPNWFAATMGTGILALVLPQVPGASPTLRAAGEGLWFANIGLFALFSMLYAARWALYPQEAKRILGHGVASMFLGTIPMGLATIINGFLVFGEARWGGLAVGVAQALWWADVAMSLGCGVVIPYCMFTRQQHVLEQMTAVWLLPVVAAEVAAASGGLLAPHLSGAGAQFLTLVVSYALWAYSVPVAFCILTILILRMALHKLPHESMAASSWLGLGPIGTGAFGMLVLGGASPAIFAAQHIGGAGNVAAGLGLIVGTLLWGFGLWWLLLSVLITVHYFKAAVPFNLGWWGYTFPLGVYTVATLKLGGMLGLMPFTVFGTVLAAALGAIWLLMAGRTLHGGWKGHLFFSPCIAKTTR